MQPTSQDRLKQALRDVDLPVELQQRIFNAVFAPRAKTRKIVSAELTWDALLRDITAAINNLRSNVKKHRPEYRECYAEYLQLLLDTKRTIESTRALATMKDPNSPDPEAPRIPATVAEISRRAVLRNMKTGMDGPTCGTLWQSWVAPADRKWMTERFEMVFNNAMGGRGICPRPFVTSNVKRSADAAVTRLRSFIDNQRRTYADGPTLHPTSTTPLGALMLAATRMCEIALDRWVKERNRNAQHALTDPLPVNWVLMLSDEMRLRVTQATLNTANVSLEGLADFYAYQDDTSTRGKTFPPTTGE